MSLENPGSLNISPSSSITEKCLEEIFPGNGTAATGQITPESTFVNKEGAKNNDSTTTDRLKTVAASAAGAAIGILILPAKSIYDSVMGKSKNK